MATLFTGTSASLKGEVVRKQKAELIAETKVVARRI